MVLNDVSLQIKSGEFLGICGKSGSGKSTLANLMAGLLDGYDGEVFVGGENIRKVPHDWMTKNLIYLGQDGYLMNLSIRDNILFYSQSHTDEDLEKVLRLVKLEEWIKKRQRAWIQWSVNGQTRYPAENVSVFCWHGRCCGIRRFLFLMKALLRWTSIRKKRLWKISENFIRMQREFLLHTGKTVWNCLTGWCLLKMGRFFDK